MARYSSISGTLTKPSLSEVYSAFSIIWFSPEVADTVTFAFSIAASPHFTSKAKPSFAAKANITPLNGKLTIISTAVKSNAIILLLNEFLLTINSSPLIFEF